MPGKDTRLAEAFGTGGLGCPLCRQTWRSARLSHLGRGYARTASATGTDEELILAFRDCIPLSSVKLDSGQQALDRLIARELERWC
ncbi:MULTISPECIES: hypothetical protein [unclassified Streptomyces]|uniref:hypothetical protein n=1 Tax=unclassified Streptomyces TaxID=2593676 RepID=UPI0036DFE588